MNMSNAEVLMRLYNRSSQRGMGLLNSRGAYDMTLPQAKILIEECEANGLFYFDYLYGRVMKIDVSERPLNGTLYERDNGPDSVLDALTGPQYYIE
jgi:hypothetical protein